MPAPKTLIGHLLEGTFRAQRHAALLERKLLPSTPPPSVDGSAYFVLRELQRYYNAATRPSERAAIAREFAAAALELAGLRPPMTFQQDFAARCGCLPLRRLPGMTPEEDRATRRRFREWRALYADDFRAGRPCPPPPSLTEPAKVTRADRKPPLSPVVIVGLGGPVLRGKKAERYLQERGRL